MPYQRPNNVTRASDIADYKLMAKYIEAHRRRGTQPAPASLERFRELERCVGGEARGAA